MKLAEFHYDLPPERIAQEPWEPRDHSRLLVVYSATQTLQHRRFFEIEHSLRSGDALVLNATKVFPARLRGKKKTGGKVELLLLERSADASVWRALVRGATSETDLEFPEGLTGRMERRLTEGEWDVRFSGGDVRAWLDRHGEMPLPPYIKRPEPRAHDLNRYQTVYAEYEGAVAAPTAGFHFTPELLDRLRVKGVHVVYVTLHVGWGTFRPVRTETIEEHRMLSERYVVDAVTARVLNAVRANSGRIIAVGTTAVRTLESVADDKGMFRAGEGETSLYIYPGYPFKAIDGLVTNFHLPDSTPLLLANAFYADKHKKNAASPFVLRFAYDAAIHEGYRFYSYGDAMLIL